MDATKKLRADALQIWKACLAGADPERAVKRGIAVFAEKLIVHPDFEIDLKHFKRIFVVGGGKASALMANALENLLGDRITGGLISVKYGHGLPLRRIEVVEAGHPLPDSAGEDVTRRIIDLLRSLERTDLVITCISGGGSALMPGPAEGITLEQKQQLTSRLLAVGADIHEINAVRKHLSGSKGGNLMRFAYPAFVVNLMLSDVVGDEPDTIASGPFCADSTSFQDVMEILQRYGLTEGIAPQVLDRIRRGLAGDIPENPKPWEEIFRRVRNVIVGSNILSLRVGEKEARTLGYRTLILSSSIEGDTSEAAFFHAAVAREIRTTGYPVAPPACLLSGGETTVVLKAAGLGGRNQHFALSLVRKAAEIRNSVFLSAGTDGSDGPTDAAGAIVDDGTLHRALSLGLNPQTFLANNDSYNFFRPLGDLIITGPTRTNVMDVRIVLVAS